MSSIKIIMTWIFLVSNLKYNGKEMSYIVLTRRFVEQPLSQQSRLVLHCLEVRMSLLYANEEFQPLPDVNKAEPKKWVVFLLLTEMLICICIAVRG
jgi:hypothetical protein